MAQDTALLRYLLKWARRAPWSWSQRDLAFAFDWTNDYISSPTIGRTGYDMNVSGNVTTGSDGDGSYIQFNGNRDATAATWTLAICTWWTTPVFSQATSFTIKDRVKVISLPPNNVTGLFGSVSDTCIHIESQKFRFTVRWSTNTNFDSSTFSLNTLYDLYLVYDAARIKFYAYIWTSWWASTLLNTWGTTWPATFSTDTRRLWDTAIWAWTPSSCNVYHYHSAVRNKALTQAEIDADIALWNTTKQDPSIVAYYVPENLQYNTQYMLNPKDLDQSPRAYTGATVTANTDVAPDGTTTADNIVFWAATHRLVQQTITAITWSALASKTFIVKAFVKCTTGTQTFRFRMDHAGVDTNQYSSDFTATTTRQEFTFTRALTSSTSWTWLFIAVANNSAWTAQTIQVRNVRVYLVNETLRDESPNIWWFIGRKTQKVFSCRYKPNADFADAPDAWALMVCPRSYMHDRSSTHQLQIRYDNRFWARTSIATLWASYRTKVHALWLIYFESWVFKTKIYVNWSLVDSDVRTVDPAITNYNTVMRSWRKWSTYFSWNIRDARIYTFTWSFTDADALAIYNGGEPTSAWVTKYLHYKPPVGEVGTTTQDQSPNDRDWTLNGGVTRDYI